MTATPARVQALGVLRAVRDGALADHALERVATELSGRDRAWVQELTFGTLRLRGRLDFSLAALCRRPLEQLEPDVLDILRLGAYQLLEMGSVPAYAAVSQSVELTKSVARAAAGLVNGLLSRLARDPGGVRFPTFEEEPIAHLTTWGSHPRWLVKRWVGEFGAAATRRLVEANNRRPALYLHALGGNVDGTVATLAGLGIESSRVAGMADSVRLDSGTPAEALLAVRAIVQDPAASMVARYAAPAAGVMFADLCAAPGGKTLALAASVEPPDYIVACDVGAGRVRRLDENVRRIGSVRVGVVVADARRPPIREVDAVLIDAPCTGTGTFQRHPDARWRLRPSDLAALVNLQAELLEAAVPIVRAGGILVYATCSIEAEENERQMEALRKRHPEFQTETPPSIDARFLDESACLRMTPHEHGFDGAFAARLRRR